MGAQTHTRRYTLTRSHVVHFRSSHEKEKKKLCSFAFNTCYLAAVAALFPIRTLWVMYVRKVFIGFVVLLFLYCAAQWDTVTGRNKDFKGQETKKIGQ